MITNLFSIFDPTTNIFNFSLNWLRTFIGLLIIPYLYWLIPTRIIFFYNFVSFILFKEIKILLGPKIKLGCSFLFISLFSFILFNNFLGLFPYIFTRTRHLILTLTLALPLWLSFIIYGWLNYTQHIFIHLIPQGTPSILIPFIICIETIRNLIRPITLSIRLTANIIAGHLLLTLISNTGNLISTIILRILIFLQIILLILETAVAIIQSYVFTILSTLYSREINN